MLAIQSKALNIAVALVASTSVLFGDATRFLPTPAPALADDRDDDDRDGRWNDRRGGVQQIECASWNYRNAYCRVDGLRDARLDYVVGGRCVEGQTWGYDRGGVWVKDGCRARFSVAQGWNNGRGNGWGNGGWSNNGWNRDRNWDDRRGWDDDRYGSGGQDIRCSSRNFDYRFCSADTRGGVRLAERFSSARCIEGRSWGYDRRGIWVDDGCSARFVTGSGFGGDYGRDRNRESNAGLIAAVVIGAGLLALLASNANRRGSGQRSQSVSDSAQRNGVLGEQQAVNACLDRAQSQAQGGRAYIDELTNVERRGDQVDVSGRLVIEDGGRSGKQAFRCTTTAGQVRDFRFA
jgi:hypothetical protein